MAAGRDQDGDALSAQQNALRTRRLHVRQLAQNGIIMPGFVRIRGFSYAFLKSLVDTALEHGNPGVAIADNIAAFLSRAMVVYSRIAAYAAEADDPIEYRTALSEGLRLALGLSSDEIAAVKMLRLLEALVARVEKGDSRLAMPFAMIQDLVTDFLDVRDDMDMQAQPEGRSSQHRVSKLKNGEYWNALAASLFQSSTWLSQNPDFMDATTVPPTSWEGYAHIMACNLEDSEGDSG